MRCNWLGWLLGLPVLALVWGLAVKGERLPIIADLEHRTQQALAAEDLVWATTHFDVIEGVLSGRAFSETERARAIEIVRATRGVWNIRDDSDLIEEAPNYVWGATVDREALQLTGFVPNEKTRRRILDAARERFPDVQLHDEMRPARGAPGHEVWVDGISFGLRQLAGLKQGGRIGLQGTHFAISGEAEDVTAYRTIKGDVARRLPNGIVLARDEVQPPRVSPFTWGARTGANQLELSGHVPSEEMRGSIVETAKQAFPNAAIVDKMTTAAGQPQNWLDVVQLILREMANLDQSRVAVSDRRVTIDGMAQKEITAQRVTAALNVGRPQNFSFDNRIKFREPTLPTISPFTTTMVSDGERVSLTGVAPDERRRQRLVALARERFPGREVVDALSYANGAPPGWLSCADAGLHGLARLDRGRAEMSDASLVVSGETRNEAVANELPAEVRANANRSCADTVNVTLKVPPEPKLQWQVLSDGARVELTGEVIDSAVQKQIVERARRLFPKREIIDQLRVKPASSTKWVKAAMIGLDQLAKLRSGVVRLDGQVLTIDGVAPDTAVESQVKNTVTRNLPSGYKGQAQIEVKSDAMIWSEQEARRKKEAAAAKAAAEAAAKEKARAAALAEVQRRAAEAAARALADAEARRRAEEAAARQKSNEDTRIAAEEASFLKRLEAERQREAAAAAREREAEAKRKATDEAARRSALEEAARQRAAAEARRRAEDERRAHEDAHQKAQACIRDLNDVVNRGEVRFEFGSDALTKSSLATLDELVATYRRCPGPMIEIAGHTDSVGSAESNLELSQRRAEAVLAYFVSKGLPRAKFVARGYGETRPRSSNRSEQARAINRRIEFDVVRE